MHGRQYASGGARDANRGTAWFGDELSLAAPVTLLVRSLALSVSKTMHLNQRSCRSRSHGDRAPAGRFAPLRIRALAKMLMRHEAGPLLRSSVRSSRQLRLPGSAVVPAPAALVTRSCHNGTVTRRRPPPRKRGAAPRVRSWPSAYAAPGRSPSRLPLPAAIGMSPP